jgi:hypothetical protein
MMIGRIARRLISSLACALVALGGMHEVGPCLAASLSVEASAAFSGEFGLRVTPGCGHPFSLDVTMLPPSATPVEVTACTTITAHSVEVTPPGAVFTAGQIIALGDLFAVTAGAAFTAIVDDALVTFAWVEDRSPGAEAGYKTSFFVDLDQLTIEPGDRLEHFVAYAAGGVPWLRVVLKRSPVLPENRLVLEARRDDGSWLSTEAVAEELVLEPGWNEVRLDWRAADSGQNNGSLVAEVRNVGSGHVNSAELSCLVDPGDECLTNAGGRIETVRWGVVGGVLDGTAGSLELDSFISWR